MSSCPWRCRLIRGDLPCVCLLVLASTSASRLSSRSSLSSRLPAPFARVVGRGAWASLSFACRARIVSRVGCDCGLLRDGDECVDFVDCLLSVDWRGRHRVYCISCLVDGASADFVGFLGRCLISSDKAGGFSPPHVPLFFPFFGSGGGDFLSLAHHLLNTYSGAACLPVLRLRLNGINA